MEKFQVPQFIEAEDKIVGPLSLSQFLYIGAGGAILFAIFFFVRPWVWFVFAAIIGSTAFVFAFVKINGHSFAKILYLAFKYYWNPRLYLWQKTAPEGAPPEAELEIPSAAPLPPTPPTPPPKKAVPQPRKQKVMKVMRESVFSVPKFGKLTALWRELLTSRKKLGREQATPEHYARVRGLGGTDVTVKRIDYQS